MIDEWSSEVIVALERMLTEASTVQSFFFVFLVHSHCTSFVELIFQTFCCAQSGSLVNFAFVCT